MKDITPSRPKITRVLLLSLGVLFICWLVFALLMVAGRYLFVPNQDEAWKQKTTPLPYETLNDICSALLITDDALCQNKREVYAPEIFPHISRIFDKEDTTYQDVQLKLGKYQVELEPLSKRSDGSTYFISAYDLRGDGVTPIAFFFYGTYTDNSLMRIMYRYGDDHP